MYRPQSKQVSVFENKSFFQFQGLNPDNDWVRLAKLIPWAELERRYARTFDSKLGNAGKPARIALGALIIKERYGFSDEDTVQEIRMNPYLQLFLGLPAFQHEAPFDAGTMTLFCKRTIGRKRGHRGTRRKRTARQPRNTDSGRDLCAPGYPLSD